MAAMKDKMGTQASFDAVQWLNGNALGANQLRKESLNSVLHFSLMWNVFEGSLCNQNAGIQQFERVVSELDGREVLRYEYFSSFLDYFRTRYITAGEPNERFMQLRFRRNEKEDLVLSVLKGQESHIPSIVLALLLIVYRFRNNLFHGIKWAYALDEQTDNFEQANRLLAKLIELSNSRFKGILIT